MFVSGKVVHQVHGQRTTFERFVANQLALFESNVDNRIALAQCAGSRHTFLGSYDNS